MLRLFVSDQADALVARLGDELHRNPLADPLSSEVIAVPSRGIERWMSQRLAVGSDERHEPMNSDLDHHVGLAGEGISANTTYVLLHDYLTDLVGASGREGQSPWHPQRLRWTLARLVEDDLRDADLGILTDYLHSQSDQPGNRLDATRYVAELFDRYHWQRPEMISRWASGLDEIAVGDALPPQHGWQSVLWRAARQAIGTPSPAESLNHGALDGVQQQLPPRLSVFELTRLTLGQARVLSQLSEIVDVDLYLLFPSRTLWDKVARTCLTNPTSVRRFDDEFAVEIQHPILRSWAADAVELQRVLASVAPTPLQAATWVPGHRRGESVLGHVQQQLFDDTPPSSAGSNLASTWDQSISIHSCHGAKRQVEVLRDAIKHALADDPSLEPRDVLVMCPDIEQFAPHIRSVFEAEPQLRVRLADRAPIHANPLMAAVVNLLSLAATRCSAPDVVSFLTQPLVRQRFGIEEEDLPRITDWILAADVRWGLSASHRRTWGIEIANVNTWDNGLNRLALGVAMADDHVHLVGQTQPLDDVPSSDIPLAAALIEFLAVLEEVVLSLNREMTVLEGLEHLDDAMERLVAPIGPDEWMRRAFRSDLEELKTNVTNAGAAALPASLDSLSVLLSDYQRGRSGRENFRSGDITFATLTPMRSVPHRVVALLGMDDGTFPRAQRSTGDDLTVIDPQIGDWDPRREDRQLLLDALMAAQDRLIITYSGHDERTNDVLSPCVPIAELIDVVASLRGPVGQPRDRQSVIASHPLHSFDARNFSPGALVADTVWSFSHKDWRACQAALGPRDTNPPALISGQLPRLEPKLIEISELISFLKHPTKHFFHRRLNLDFRSPERKLSADFSIEGDALSNWSRGAELLSLLSEVPDDQTDSLIAQWLRVQQTSGSVGPMLVQRQKLLDLAEVAKAIDVQKRRRIPGPLHSEFFAVDLAGGVEVAGAIRVSSKGRVVRATPSRVLLHGSADIPKPGVLELWVEVLVRAAATGERTLGYLVGKDNAGRAIVTVNLRSPTDSQRVLTDLVQLYMEGINRPLMLFPRTSAAAAGSSQVRASAAITHEWEKDKFSPEGMEEHHQRAFPGLTATELMDSEEFWSLARSLWGPIFDNVKVCRD